jgi:CheY-like chemotaxis protein
LQTIQSSGENLLQIINDILDISRIEAGKLQMASAPFDIRAVVDEVVKLVAIAAGAKDVRVTAQIDPSLPQRVAGDLMRFRQVLTNLAGNAVKFTDAGEVVIHVGALWEIEASLAVRLKVQDSGIGIDENTIAHLFTPFTQADASGTRKYGGTGLGLAISRQLVGLMGGEIGVNSEVGKGSTFWFTAIFEKTTALRPEAPAATQEPIAVRHGNILMAEDNEVNQRIAKRILEKAGHSVAVVTTGLQAIGKLMEASYDLVLMDVQMPVMDGLTATAQIRRLEGAIRDIPIIALTAHAMTGDRDTCLNAGMDDYITKPFRPEEMLATVQRHLSRS